MGQFSGCITWGGGGCVTGENSVGLARIDREMWEFAATWVEGEEL